MKLDEFNKNCGEILRCAVFLETTLENFICDYFEILESDRKKLFRDLLVYKMNFEKKFEIFLKRCKEETIRDARINELSIDVKFIQKIRNLAAHGQALFDVDQKMKVYRKYSIIEEKDFKNINPELVKEIEEKTFKVSEKINNINYELYKKFNNIS